MMKCEACDVCGCPVEKIDWKARAEAAEKELARYRALIATQDAIQTEYRTTTRERDELREKLRQVRESIRITLHNVAESPQLLDKGRYAQSGIGSINAIVGTEMESK